MSALMKKITALLLCTMALALFVVGGARTNRDPIHEQPKPPPLQLSGEKAQHYLQETLDGQSLMQAVTAARFGLQWQEHAPGESKSSGGYLGVSHEQDLNAWFSEDGVTMRPTVSKEEPAPGWQLAFRLKAYGYSDELIAAPPIVSQKVKGTRIEYQRGLISLNQPPTINHQRLTEWYENRPAGIEQGFTLNERPHRENYVSTDELRLVMAVEGDLHADVKQDGQAIELSDAQGKRTLSYSKLAVFDAEGKRLAARMEASPDGREIALVVEDQNASYPVVIDPVMASPEQKLEGSTAVQTDARFGYALAIEGNRAVVGAWRHDSGNVDIGYVFTFTRSGTNWSLATIDHGANFFANSTCGWSVAISGSRIAWGCPGTNAQAGRAFTKNLATGISQELVLVGGSAAGDQFGYSVAINGDKILVGAPFSDYYAPDSGQVYYFGLNKADGSFVYALKYGSNIANEQFGASLAYDGFHIAAGAPGYQSGKGRVAFVEPQTIPIYSTLLASDGAAGDNFGNSVDFKGNTMVIGAYGDDDKGADAGAAYVFMRDANGAWSQQQKLTASDGGPGDHFSEHAVAVEGDTIVVGADEWDLQPSGDNAGAAYIFTRNAAIWAQKAALYGKAADNFGISVDLSGDTFLVGARAADSTGGTPRAGAAYVYRLPKTTLGNVSTRLPVETGDNALIGGFIITGTQPKKVMVRAIGPSIPLGGVLADPQLQIFDSSGAEIAFNNNWRDATNRQEIINSTIAPGNDLESAVLRSFNPGAYTAIVRGVNDTTGVGLVEAYDLDSAASSKLANISTRGLVQTGDNVLIAGTIVVGWTSQKVIVRAIGPSLTLPGRIGDPTLELRDSNGVLLEANDNWGDSPNKQAIIDSGIPPTHTLESAVVRTVPPASYTAIVRGVGATTGIAVVEVYALN
jgi:hypothetical protein